MGAGRENDCCTDWKLVALKQAQDRALDVYHLRGVIRMPLFLYVHKYKVAAVSLA